MSAISDEGLSPVETASAGAVAEGGGGADGARGCWAIVLCCCCEFLKGGVAAVGVDAGADGGTAVPAGVGTAPEGAGGTVGSIVLG